MPVAWFPGAIRKEVTRHRTPISRYRGHCLHIAVSEADSLFGFFNTPGNPTSHFYVRYTGVVEQYVDTRFVAPAQLEGNPTMIGTESQGGTTDLDSTGWTAAQRETIARINAWLFETHGIPLAPMRDSLPSSGGIGYHRLGIDPWRVDGGELWSKSYGKLCPGAARIAQVPGTITRAKQLIQGDGTMAFTDEQINDLVRSNLEIAQILRTHAVRMGELVNHELPAVLNQLTLIANRLDYVANNALPAIKEDTDRIADKLAGPDSN